MAKHKILLPYNFTEMDRKTVDFVIRTFSHQESIEITLFHIYTPPPAIETDSSTVMGRLTAGMQYLSKQMKEKEQVLAETRAYLLENGFEDRQVNYIFRGRTKQLADEIKETVKEGDFSMVVLNYRPYRVTRLFIQSVHSKVISALRGVTVCIVT